MIDAIKNFIKMISEPFAILQDFLTSLTELFRNLCEFIPSPFDKIALSGLAIIVAIIILKILGGIIKGVT